MHKIRQIFAATLLIIGLLASRNANAEQNRYRGNGPSEWDVLIQVGADMGFPSKNMDSLTGVTYGRKFNNLFLGNVAAGFRVWKSLYFGARYQGWLATQDYVGDAGPIVNEFRYQAIGPEVGYVMGNPRVFWLVSGAVYLPIELVLHQRGTGNNYKRLPPPATFEGRGTLGVRLGNRMSVQFTGGYRFADFGNLTASGTPLYPTSTSLNLSSFFLGVGLGVTF